MNHIIVHYAEIAIKGGNRKFFEEKLVNNIKTMCQTPNVKRISGRILIREQAPKKIGDVLKNIFGVSSFSFSVKTGQNIDLIRKTGLELLKNKEFRTFRISAKRSDKKFPLSSQEINEKVGEFIVKNLEKKVDPHTKRELAFSAQKKYYSRYGVGVDLENPDITIFIEIVENSAFLYTEKFKGPGGLPAGSSGKGILLLSGGIDSPIAAFFAQKRGVETIYLHFHSYPFTSKNSIARTKGLIKILNKFQPKSKLILIPFAPIQKAIVSKTPKRAEEKLRTILYRRFMMRIAEKLAEKENAKILITGEVIGQVASQTLENLNVVEETVKIPIIRPLAGFDKEEIISIAKNIGTYETSILPCDDTCSLFAPLHPEIKADLKNIKSIEKKLNVENLVMEAIENSESEMI